MAPRGHTLMLFTIRADRLPCTRRMKAFAAFQAYRLAEIQAALFSGNILANRVGRSFLLSVFAFWKEIPTIISLGKTRGENQFCKPHAHDWFRSFNMPIDPIAHLCMITATAGVLFIGSELARMNDRAEDLSLRLSHGGEGLVRGGERLGRAGFGLQGMGLAVQDVEVAPQ